MIKFVTVDMSDKMKCWEIILSLDSHKSHTIWKKKQRIYSSFKDEPLVLLFWLPGMGVNWRWHQTTAKSSLRFYCCCPCSFWPLTRLVLLLRFYCCCPCSLWPLTRPFKCRSEVSSAFCSFFSGKMRRDWEKRQVVALFSLI